MTAACCTRRGFYTPPPKKGKQGFRVRFGGRALLRGRALSRGRALFGQTWLLGRIGKNSPFQKAESFCQVSQNGLAFLGRIGKVSFSEFPEIYGSLHHLHHNGGVVVAFSLHRVVAVEETVVVQLSDHAPSVLLV